MKSLSNWMAITALAAALAAQAANVTYLDPTGSAPSQKTADCIQYNGQTTLDSGWYVVEGSVYVDTRIAVFGDVNLILKDNAELVANKGITVDVYNNITNSLTIWAQSDGANRGKLTATGSGEYAGIGGTDTSFGCGTVTVNGGTVTANGGLGGAGIGGGYGGSGGTVTVNGGTVAAHGGDCGAGIGGGRGGDGGTVVVNGGAVEAHGVNGAGIGGGFGYAGGGAGGEVTINGGTVTAQGDKGGAGIGSCRSTRAGGKVTINGGEVTARGDEGGAGIGGGDGGAGGEVTINGGTVEAHGGAFAAGIGGGYVGAGGEVTVNGGTVVAYGGDYGGAGIGSGGGGATVESSPSAGTLTVNGGTVEAHGGEFGAGIGGGHGGAGGMVVIHNGTVTAQGGENGAGIGGGWYGDGGTVVIHGGTVTAQGDGGGAAIGAGRDVTNDGSLSIDGMRVGYVEADGKVHEWTTCGDWDGYCRNSDGKTVRIEVCSPHRYKDGSCRWCGTANPLTGLDVQTSAGSAEVNIAFNLAHDVAGDAPAWNRPYLSVTARDTATGAIYVSGPGALTGDTGTGAGDHSVTWNMSGVLPDGLVSTGVVFTVEYLNMPDYCVIDLSGGTNAAHYAVSYLDAEPEGGFTNDLYRTTKLAMRLVAPEANDKQPFYCAVFETTQRQWELVKGDRPSYFTNETCYAMRPVEKVSWNMIRGDSATYDWPSTNAVDGASFVGVLRLKSGLSSLDLPTQAQWEYACRAGTTTKYNNGSDDESSMDLLGRYRYNGGALFNGSVPPGGDCETNYGTAAVGSYDPNAWGLYDMHGNVLEWCLDWYFSGSYRVLRGGGWDRNASYCTSSARDAANTSSSNSDYGFRLVRTLSSNLESERSAEAAAGAERAGTVCYGASEPTAIIPTYTITVEGGSTTNLLAAAGETVAVTADAPADGEAFVQWSGDVEGLAFDDLYAAETTFAMPATNVTVKAEFAPIEIADIAGQVYTGSAIEPRLDVSCNGQDLVAGTDYDVSYTNNTNVGTATATVAMKSPRTGSASKDFTITPRAVTFSGQSETNAYTGSEIVITNLVVGNLVAGHTHNVTFSASGTGAGSYDGTITPESSVVIKSGEENVTANYDITVVNGALTITKISVGGGTEEPGGGEVPAGGVSKFDASFVYDGKGHIIDTNALVAAFSAAMGEGTGITYAPDDGGAPSAAWTAEAPAFTNAGEYVVWYTASNPNYEDFVHAAKVTITKAANAWITAPTMKGWTVGATPATPNRGRAKFGTATVAYGKAGGAEGGLGATRPSAAGSYVATFTVAATANYGGLVKNVSFTIKAKPAQKTYKVKFSANGGKLPKGKKMAAQTFTAGKAKKLRGNAFMRDGYVFIGWSTRKNGPVAYKNGQKVKNIGKAGKSVTLYAAWAKETYIVVFDASGGRLPRGVKMPRQTFTYGEPQKLRKNRFIRKGYVFAGWAIRDPLATVKKIAYKDGQKVKNLSPDGRTVKLYAVWKRK